MNPTNLMTKLAAKMSNEELCKALSATCEAIKVGGGSITLQGSRWQMLTALKAEAAKPSRKW